MFVIAAIGFSVIASVTTFFLLPSLMSMLSDRSVSAPVSVR